uniref:tRNA synthetases class I catalytic domain-containing protein n=1 Tax=Chromera velia CCMP2878 TaxID=1169474 RepID=A0A0G4HV33_9ALVE|eukprot:Cvel_32019.t1-p1 / transcript=Cvel_32019.t1 / gene=Cvel_32019 / organism=Chromera_velia_CCMP2878 / gene_product=Cysteine--tRNA ligase, cytoplasmic, putative / transcript_product=Cysteine--tRNA ligase, cytoplasmic, putative / location=Cvel_scaffold4883:4130-5347(+) / protein_length=406 / sequence_SO=supercontig / SO=protein_coding / is_pseudo=false
MHEWSRGVLWRGVSKGGRGEGGGERVRVVSEDFERRAPSVQRSTSLFGRRRLKESPFGSLYGPGWHIECSAMASDALGFPIDIHLGGIDLWPPHHDNELAQSEACKDEGQWVNYFLHTGHLDIDGRKMSKSLKNFVTIKELLKEYSPRLVRLLFLMHAWDGTMNYNPSGETFRQVRGVDKGFVTFFDNVRGVLRNIGTNGPQRWRPEAEGRLAASLDKTTDLVHTALLKNFNLPLALPLLQELVSEGNRYLNETARSKPRAPILRKVADYIFRMVAIFGLTNGSAASYDYTETERGMGGSSGGASLQGLLDELVASRASVREGAKALMQLHPRRGPEPEPKAVKQEVKKAAADLLTLCDKVRDEKLVAHGVRIKDRKEGAIWTLSPSSSSSSSSSSSFSSSSAAAD